MTHRDTDIVSAVRACLRDRLGEERFELWFGGSHRFGWADGTLQIDVESAFRAERLRARLLSDVVAVLDELVDESFQVVFDVDPGLQASDPVPHTHVDANALTALPSSQEARISGGRESVAVAEVDSRANHWKREATGRRFSSLRTLVRGQSNQIACHAAQIVIEQPAQVNPLFVHGPSGVGKTHLLEGIWSEVRRRGGRRIIYLSAEQFTTYFLQALRGSGLPSFRQKYRAVDLFILDDLQFFAGKQATVTELLHTMDCLLREARQLVLAADRPPGELEHLGAELQTRIAGGLVCGLQPLDRAMRREVIQRLAVERAFQFSEGVLDRIADRAPGDARQLAGIVNRLWATELTTGREISPAVADEVLTELCPGTAAIVNLQDIQRVICDEFGLVPEQLCSNRRTRDVSHPRMLAMWLARKHTRAALTEIGEFFGRRSHSTVVSAQNKVDRWVHDGQQLQLTTRPCDVKTVLSRLERSLRA